MQFKATAKSWRKISQEVTDVPYAFVQDQIRKGVNRPSYVSRHIQQVAQDDAVKRGYNVEEAIKWTASNIYAGGADTTVAVISAFFLAMVIFPKVQKKKHRQR